MLIATSPLYEMLTKEIHQWLVDEKHADEKEAIRIHYGKKQRQNELQTHGIL